MKRPATDQQAAQQKTTSPAVWPLVIKDVLALKGTEWLKQALAEDMSARDKMWREKYGTPLHVDNGRDAATDAYQEALDLAVYARQKLEQTGSPFWADVSGQAVRLAAAIRYQMNLDDSGRS